MYVTILYFEAVSIFRNLKYHDIIKDLPVCINFVYIYTKYIFNLHIHSLQSYIQTSTAVVR